MQEIRLSPKTILHSTLHRPWQLPNYSWNYDQKWLDPLFLNIVVKREELEELIPSSLTLDSYHGEYLVSIVLFEMQDLHPRYLPNVKPLSNFFQINIRTYVTRDNKPGVYFLHIENSNPLATAVARYLSGLPFQKASIQFEKHRRTSNNLQGSTRLEVEFEWKTTALVEPNNLELWFSERYCLYQEDSKGSMRRFELHHLPWKLYPAKIKLFHAQYKIGALNLASYPLHSAYFSPGVRVLTFPGQILEG